MTEPLASLCQDPRAPWPAPVTIQVHPLPPASVGSGSPVDILVMMPLYPHSNSSMAPYYLQSKFQTFLPGV